MALGLFLLSVAAFLFGTLFEGVKGPAASKVTEEIGPAVKRLSLFGVGVSAAIAVVQSVFWRPVILTFTVFAALAYFLPQYAEFLQRHHEILYGLPFAIGFVNQQFRKDIAGQIASLFVSLIVFASIWSTVVSDPASSKFISQFVQDHSTWQLQQKRTYDLQ